MPLSAKQRIVFPLDVDSLEAARQYVELLAGRVGMFKVGLELFIRCGPAVIDMIAKQGGVPVFLDLKLHDIPQTVFRAMAGIAELDVAFVTVHCGEGGKMMEAAVQASQGRVTVLGVTVLTSISGPDVQAAGFKPEFADDLSRLVKLRAAKAQAAGCGGVVCSGLETAMLRAHLGPAFTLVTPGIRPLWATVPDDQQRVTTPAQALRDGADYLVIGRPIRDARDPQAAVDRIMDEIETLDPASNSSRA